MSSKGKKLLISLVFFYKFLQNIFFSHSSLFFVLTFLKKQLGDKGVVHI
jgi:hypothetical protein